MNWSARTLISAIWMLAASTPAHGMIESLIVRAQAVGARPALQTTITMVSEDQQEEVLKEINKQLKADPKSAAIIATTGESDDLATSEALKDIQKNNQTESVVATGLNDLPAPTSRAKNFREKIRSLRANSMLSRDKTMAILVSIVPAGNYGGLVYFMSADYVLATASFGVVLGINGFQAIFTEKWLQVAALGEKGMRVVAHAMAKMVGKTSNEKFVDYMGRFGRVAWTTALNTAIASITMTLSGTLDSVWALLFFGFSSSYDMWDQVLEDKLNKSEFFKKYFVNTRLAVGSVLECLTLAGSGYADLALTAAAATGAVALMFKPNAKDIPNVIDRPKLIDRIRIKAKKFREMFERIPSAYENVPCVPFLIA